MKKIGGAVVSVGLWLITATVLLLCILLGRLFFAPIDVGFAREQVLARTSELLPGWDIQFEEASIGWDWASVRPWLILEGTSLVDRRHRLTAEFPHVEVGIGFRGILAGVGVSTIEIDRANIHITDIGGFSDTTDDSLFADLFGANGIPKPEVFIPLTEAFNRFSLRLLDTVPTFERINFDGMSVRLFRGDVLSDATFSVTNFALHHDESDLNLSAQMDVSIGGNPVSTRLVGRASPSIGDLSIVLALNDFYPSSFPKESGLPEFLNYVRLPIDLSLELDLDADVGLQSAGIEAVLGEGELFDPKVFPNIAPVKYGLIGATYDVGERNLLFDRIDISFADTSISGNGLLYWQQASTKPGMQFDIKGQAATVGEILSYWPKLYHSDGRERGARAWVSEHMIKGDTTNIHFQVDMDPFGKGAFLKDSPYKLTFDFDQLDTLFIQTMPPIVAANGAASLTLTEMSIRLDGGTLTGMPIQGSTALLENIHVPNGGVGIFNVYTRGDVQTVMKLIDNPPLNVAQKAKLDIGRLGGTAVVKALVTASLVRAADADSITYDVTAQITDAQVDNLLGGEGLRSGQLAVKVDPDKLSAAGTGTLNGVPVNLRWDENFALGREDASADTTLIVLDGNMDASDMLALGVDIQDYVEGEMRAEGSFHGRDLKFTRGSFSADASTTVLKVNQLAWTKPVGMPASVTGVVTFGDDGVRVAPLSIQGEGIDVSAALNFAGGGTGAFNAEIDARKLGRNQLKATLAQQGGEILKASVEAESFDIAPYLAAADQANTTSAKTNDDQDESGFDLSLKAKHVLLQNEESWDDATLNLSFRTGEPVALTLDAVSGAGQTPVTLRLFDEPNSVTGERPLSASATDGGQILRGLGFFAQVNGGAFELEGKTSGWGNSWNLEGLVKIRDAVLVSSTSLDEGVTEGVISGIDSYLTNGSLALDVIDVPMTYQGRILGINGLKANGPSLGLTMEGEIATSEGLLNVNGVVVPAYGINSLLGNLPIVGGIFSGGDGKGLFGVTYRVQGSTKAPDVSVSTLSGLAPGFLRLLFEGRKGRIKDVEMPEPLGAPDEGGDQREGGGDLGRERFEP